MIFFLSRMHWIIALYYYSDQRASALMMVSIVFSLLAVAMGYGITSCTEPRTAAFIGRLAVLAAFLYFVAIQIRQVLIPGVELAAGWQAAIGFIGLSLATMGAMRMVDVWSRLRAAMVTAALIAISSVFGLVAVLAPHIELFAGTEGPHRPVVVLLFDEFSAGSAQPLAAALGRRQMNVESWEVPSIGRNTIDAIPGIFSGASLPALVPARVRLCAGTVAWWISRACGYCETTSISSECHHRYCAIGRSSPLRDSGTRPGPACFDFISLRIAVAPSHWSSTRLQPAGLRRARRA